jgi:hypothetical protein
MFKNVEDVQNVTDAQIVTLVNEGWNACLADFVHEDELEAFIAARKLVSKYENMAEKMAFAVRDRFNQILENTEDFEETFGFDPDYQEENIDEFMNAIAGELGQNYNGEYEHRPDYFWTPSSC